MGKHYSITAPSVQHQTVTGMTCPIYEVQLQEGIIVALRREKVSKHEIILDELICMSFYSSDRMR